MKAFFLVLLLLVSSVASAQVTEQKANNNVGQQFIRLINNSNRYASCYYRDGWNYLTFTIAPNTITAWQPIYGAYVWECRYY